MKPLTATYPRVAPGGTIPTHTAHLRAWSSPTVRQRSRYPALLSSRLVRAAPLLFFQTYLAGSILAFAFGPVVYNIANPLSLYTYVGVGQLAIALGYFFGTTRLPRRYTGFCSARSLLKITILLTVVLLPITLQYRNYGNLGFSEALTDPNAAYMARLKSFEDAANTPLLSATRGILSPLLALFLPMGIVYWRTMQLPWKILWMSGFAGVVALAIFSGAAVGLFD